jgi:hypothetical protein
MYATSRPEFDATCGYTGPSRVYVFSNISPGTRTKRSGDLPSTVERTSCTPMDVHNDCFKQSFSIFSTLIMDLCVLRLADVSLQG